MPAIAATPPSTGPFDLTPGPPGGEGADTFAPVLAALLTPVTEAVTVAAGTPVTPAPSASPPPTGDRASKIPTPNALSPDLPASVDAPFLPLPAVASADRPPPRFAPAATIPPRAFSPDREPATPGMDLPPGGKDALVGAPANDRPRSPGETEAVAVVPAPTPTRSAPPPSLNAPRAAPAGSTSAKADALVVARRAGLPGSDREDALVGAPLDDQSNAPPQPPAGSEVVAAPVSTTSVRPATSIASEVTATASTSAKVDVSVLTRRAGLPSPATRPLRFQPFPAGRDTASPVAEGAPDDPPKTDPSPATAPHAEGSPVSVSGQTTAPPPETSPQPTLQTWQDTPMRGRPAPAPAAIAGDAVTPTVSLSPVEGQARVEPGRKSVPTDVAPIETTSIPTDVMPVRTDTPLANAPTEPASPTQAITPRAPSVSSSQVTPAISAAADRLPPVSSTSVTEPLLTALTDAMPAVRPVPVPPQAASTDREQHQPLRDVALGTVALASPIVDRAPVAAPSPLAPSLGAIAAEPPVAAHPAQRAEATPAPAPPINARTVERPAPPFPNPAPVVLPALQAFGAALHRAAVAERRPLVAAGEITPLAPLAAMPVSFSPLPAAPAPVDTTRPHWPEAMIARIDDLRDAANAADTRIRLHPDALGAVEVQVRREADAVSVHFTAAEPATQRLLADAQPRLAELAEARGIRLTQSGADAQGSMQGQGDRRQPAPAPVRSPRLTPAAPTAADPDTDQRLA